MSKINVRAQFLRNVGSGWLAQLSSALVGFVLLPYNLHHLGKDVYGICVLVMSFIAMLEFLSLGMRPSLLRFFSQTLAKDDQEEFQTISSTSQLLLGGLGLLGAVLIFASTPFFLTFYDIAEPQHQETSILMACAAVSFFVQFLSIVFQNILFAAGRNDLLNFGSILASWFRLLLVVVFFNLYPPSLIGLGLASLIATLLQAVMTFYFSFRAVGSGVFPSYAKLKTSVLTPILSFSALTLIGQVTAIVSIQTPLLVIGKTLGTESASLFAPAMVITSFLAAFLYQIAMPLTPIASRDKIVNEGRNIGRLALLFSEIVAYLGCGGVLITFLFMPELMQIWIGKDFVATGMIVAVFSLGIIYESIQSVNYSFALGTSTIVYVVYSGVVIAVLTFSGTWIGTAYFGWTLLEVAYYLTILRLIRSVGYVNWTYSFLLQYNYIQGLVRVYVKPTLLAAVTCVVLNFLFHATGVSPNESLPLLCMKMIVAGTIYAILSWVVATPEVRELFLKKMRR